MHAKHQTSRRPVSARRAAGFLTAALLLFAAAGLGAQEAQQEEPFDINLHRRISGLTSAQPPRVVDDHVLLTYNGTTNARYVAAAFAHEDFTRIHPYDLVQNRISNSENPNDTVTTRVFALAYPVPEDVEVLEYRIVVDGLWQTDPANPVTRHDANGMRLSALELPERPPAPEQTPDVVGPGRVEFVFAPEPDTAVENVRGQRFDLPAVAGLNVTVAGSFNNWDPFMHPLQETRPGVYRLSVPVTPGRHHYYFVVDGRRIPDPGNTRRTRHADGFQVSSFTVP